MTKPTHKEAITELMALLERLSLRDIGRVTGYAEGLLLTAPNLQPVKRKEVTTCPEKKRTTGIPSSS